MENVIIQKRHSEYGNENYYIEQTFGSRPALYGEHHLQQVYAICQKPEYAAAGEHLDKYVVVHIGENPVIDVVRQSGAIGS